MRATLALFFVVGCNVTQTGDLGNLVFDDNESLQAPGAGAFAVGDELSFNATIAAGAAVSPGEVVALSSDEGVIQFDPAPGGLSFRGVVVGEGEADLEVVDALTLALIDQISLRSSLASSIAIGLADPFSGSESLGETFSSLHMFPRDQMSFLTNPISSTGEELKGQLPVSLSVGNGVATMTLTEGLIGEPLSVEAVALGSTDVLIETAFTSQLFPIVVVSPDDATITLTIPELGAEPISQGTLLIDSVLSDGNNIDSDRYEVAELCVEGSAGSPCRLDLGETFTPNAFFFSARLNGLATISVVLIDIDGEPLKTELIDVEVVAQ